MKSTGFIIENTPYNWSIFTYRASNKNSIQGYPYVNIIISYIDRLVSKYLYLLT